MPNNDMEILRKLRLVLIGSPKCGTTAIAKMLSQHPEMSFGINKEPNIFINSPTEIRCRLNENYSNITASHLFDASTAYSKIGRFDDVAARMMQLYRLYEYKLPIIVMCYRDPFERIKSHINYDIWRGRFMAAEAQSNYKKNQKYFNYSRYHDILQLYECQGYEDIILINQSMIKDNYIEICNYIFKRLGLAEHRIELEIAQNMKNMVHPKMMEFINEYGVLQKINRNMPSNWKNILKKLISRDRSERIDVKIEREDEIILKDQFAQIKNSIYNYDQVGM